MEERMCYTIAVVDEIDALFREFVAKARPLGLKAWEEKYKPKL